MQRWIKVVQLSVLAGLVAGATALAEPPTTAPSAGKSAKPVHHGQPQALTQAITDLSKEASDYLANPDSTSLRKASDYFKKGLPDDVTVDDVIKVIDGEVSGNPFQVAYVKWQLLSGCNDRLTPEQQAKLFEAYNDAPTPLVRFTADAGIRNQLEAAIRGKGPDDVPEINQQIDQQRKKIDDVNDVILDYRDALYSKLPVGLNSLNAALRDAVVRADASLSWGDIDKILGKFSTDADTWLATDATPQQASILLANFRQARHVAKGPQLLGTVKYDSKAKKVVLDKGYSGAIDNKTADSIELRLNAFVTHPQQNTIHFKDK